MNRTSLEQLSRPELLAQAASRNISNRDSLSDADLVNAIIMWDRI